MKDVIITGLNASDFSVSPTTLAIAQGGASQTLTIICTPGADGARSAKLTVDHNGVDSPAEYELSCTGGIVITSGGGGQRLRYRQRWTHSRMFLAIRQRHLKY